MTYRNMSDFVRDQSPLTLPPEATVKTACGRMRGERVGAVLVADENKRLLGIFTGRDAICRVLAEGKDPALTTLAEVMTRKPDAMRPDQGAVEALRLMHQGGYRHIPVVDGDTVVGIVSRGDFRGVEIDRLDEETGLWERI